MEFCGGEPSEVFLAGAVPAEKRRIDFPYGETKRLAGVEHHAAGGRRHSEAARLFGRARGPAPARRITIPALAPRHRGQGRPRRGNPAHRRRRTRPRDSAAARGGRRRAHHDAVAEARARGAADARRARPRRGRHLVLRLGQRGQGFRRRRAVARARQSDRRRTLRHAAEPAPGSRRGGRPQRGAGARRRGAVRDRPGLFERRRKGPAARRRGLKARPRHERDAGAPLGGARAQGRTL